MFRWMSISCYILFIGLSKRSCGIQKVLYDNKIARIAHQLNVLLGLPPNEIIPPITSAKRGLLAPATHKTTASVKWGNRGRKLNLPLVRQTYDASSNAAGEVVAKSRAVTAQRKCRRKLKNDEIGSFIAVVGHANLDDLSSPLSRSGFAIKLACGGHRVYWQGFRRPFDIAAEDIDNSFAAMIKCGYLRIGALYLR